MARKKEYRPYLRIGIDQDTFEKSQEILKTLKLTIGEVIGMLCNQIVLHRKIPFEMKAEDKNSERE